MPRSSPAGWSRARRWNDLPSGNETAYLALAGTVFGGAGLKLLESILGRSKRREDIATAIRTELRLELSTLRTEMEKFKQECYRLESEIDRWRTRYFALLAAVATKDVDYIEKVLQERIV